MHPLRTRFAKDIVTEFLPPSSSKLPPSLKLWRAGRRAGLRAGLAVAAKAKVVILCSGMPSFPSKPALMEFLSRKGYWVFNPRYRGSWESGGEFLRLSPERDVRDIIEGLRKGFHDLHNGTRYKLTPKEIVLIGGSFGGPAALLTSLSNSRELESEVSVGKKRRASIKVIAVSPVVDWRSRSPEEPIETFYNAVKQEFGEAYRMSRRDWDKLKTGKFYNPAAHAEEIDGKKMLIFHAKDDNVVRFGSVKKFAKKTGARLVLRAKGGHLSTSILMKPNFWKIVRKFLSH